MPTRQTINEMAGLDLAELIGHYALDDRTVPHLRLNFVSSLDGAATLDGRSGGLGNEQDQRVMNALRTFSDVVLVGAGTVRAEGYGGLDLGPDAVQWRVENGLPAEPVFAIVSGHLDLDPESGPFVDPPVRPLIFTHDGAPAHRRRALSRVADVITCGTDTVDLHQMRAELNARALPQVLCEGGPSLLGSMLEADVVDELCLSLGATMVGGESRRIAVSDHETVRQMRLVGVLRAGDMLLLRYLRR